MDAQRRRLLRLIRDGVNGAAAWRLSQAGPASAAVRAPAGGEESASRRSAQPSGLLVNLLLRGLGVSPERLRFSWIVPSIGEGVRQGAYRLQMAGSVAVLRRRSGVVWDSGRIHSDWSTAVPYTGPVLQEDSVYYWRVQVWDQHGRAAEWSDPQRLITAAGAGWSGVPIWLPEGDDAD